MSNDERPEFRALEDLKTVAAHISQELAAFRRRAKQAEAAQAGIGVGGDLRARIEELEVENADLNGRRRMRLFKRKHRVFSTNVACVA